MTPQRRALSAQRLGVGKKLGVGVVDLGKLERGR